MKGIGTDIVQINRLETVLARQGERFVERLLTPAERAEYQRRGAPVSFVAKRFAAKEAVAKALGTGIGRGVSFQHIEVANNADGAPEVVLLDGALAAAQARGGSRMLLSIADEQDYAIAYAVLI